MNKTPAFVWGLLPCALLLACSAPGEMDEARPGNTEGSGGKADSVFGEASSLEGLAGIYIVDPATPDDEGMVVLEVDGTIENARMSGNYQNMFSGGTTETGAFSALPTNAAIGFAHILLIPDGAMGPEDGTAYAIESIARNETGITALRLSILGDVGVTPNSVILWRF